MHPVLIDFPIPVHTYGVLVAMAFLLGIKITLDRAAKASLDKELVLNLFLLILVSSILGARLLYVLENAHYYFLRPLEILMVHRGGLSYFGGFLAAILISMLYARKKRVAYLSLADIFMPALALGQSIGRLGCYFNGCCFGKTTGSFWGIMFPRGSAVFADHVARGLADPLWQYSLPVIPAQLISSFADLALFCALIAVDNRKKVSGTTLFSYLAGYGLIRFCIEFLRDDSPPLALGWTLPQYLALASLFLGIAGLLRLSLKQTQSTHGRPGSSI